MALVRGKKKTGGDGRHITIEKREGRGVTENLQRPDKGGGGLSEKV